MASITPHSSISIESSPAPPPENKGSNGGEKKYYWVLDVILRVTLFATSLVGFIVMVTSKQTKMIQVAPGMAIPLDVEFSQLPAFTYYVAALSVACLYSIFSGALSIFACLKPKGSSTKLQLYFIILDAVLLGITASATGAAGGVGYIGIKGNSHTRWNKVCNVFGVFCGHIAGAIILSFISSLALVMLICLSGFVLSKKIVARS